MKIFAGYELLRPVWFFIWYNANKIRTCIAKEMTRKLKSVNFYAISNENLFYPYEFNRVSYNSYENKVYFRILENYLQFLKIFVTPF